jgi:uncharacterized pyridoxamine 5'-phosphate oxidase family protein
MIPKKIIELLKQREFISVATSDFKGRPNVAPKFILKFEDKYLYLVDYVRGTTYDNLKANPRVSISIMDVDSLIGYQINGAVEVMDKGKDFEKALEEFKQREIDLSVKRIIEGIDRGKSHGSFELSLPESAVIFKVKIEEVVEIGSKGELRKEKI